MNILGSAHNFGERKLLRQKLTSILKSWFFHPEAFCLPAQKKKDVSIHEPPLEMGFIDKLIEMFKIRKISARSQARDGTIRRIIQWVCP